MNTALSVSAISYSVGRLDILRSLDLQLDEHRFYAIAGVNGAGKSTLIKLVLDLIQPTSGGEIRIFGQDNRDRACREKLVYLPEKFDVKKNISGRQYLQFISDVYRQSLPDGEFERLAGRFDFPPGRLDDRVGAYSKGMVQKLGLVSCFMLKCPLIILDEPLSGLDPRARFRFKQVMREERERGRTVLYSTHMLADAEDLCDQFGILHDGEMKYQGTPDDCMRSYGETSLEAAYMRCIAETPDSGDSILNSPVN